MEVIDLDILRPTPRAVKIADKTIDVSFIPVAITFRVDEITKKLFGFTTEQLEKDPKAAEEAFRLSIRLCALFCEHKYPELNEAWFMANATPGQIQVFAAQITQTLVESMEGLSRYAAKNGEGAKGATS